MDLAAKVVTVAPALVTASLDQAFFMRAAGEEAHLAQLRLAAPVEEAAEHPAETAPQGQQTLAAAAAELVHPRQESAVPAAPALSSSAM